MPRQRPPDRLEQLIESATRVFSHLGYRRAQIADIAREMGVAPGTIYLYVESKEALFDLVLRRALRDDADLSSLSLPIPTPPPGATLQWLRERLIRSRARPALDAALDRQHVTDPRGELETIVRELYEDVNNNRRAFSLLSRSALDWPELAALYYQEIRRDLIRRLTHYLERRIEAGSLRPVPDAATAARLILETVTWFARHRYGDRDSAMIRDDMALETVVHFLVNALCPE